MRVHTHETQNSLKPEMALQILKEGNARFVNNLKANRNLLEQAGYTAEGQFPFAVTLSCIDSRTSVELIFDQGLGDVFSVRVAGNIINDDILASLEFACKLAGSKIIVVLGHTKCGAIKGACDHVEMGHITALLNKIQPAVTAEKTEVEDRTSSNETFVQKVSTLNVNLSVNGILEGSPILKEMLEKGEIGIVGAIHDITTGKVTFFENE